MKRPKDSQLQKIADALVVFAGYLRLPKIDSADNLSSLLFALRNHYGSVKIKKNHSAFSIELPYSTLDAVTIARLNEMVDQSENLPPEEFDEWLLNYRLNHLLKLDFNSETATPLHSDLLDRNNSSQPSDNS